MPDRSSRLAQFNQDTNPDTGEAVQVLCEDHIGTYTLPFLCRRTPDAWINIMTAMPIETVVIGWRHAPQRKGRRLL